MRRGVRGLEVRGDKASGDSARTSFSEVFGPVAATCQGDEGLLSGLSSVICGCWRRAAACCFLRSFWDSLGVEVLVLSSLALERLIERLETRVVEAWAIISRISSLEDGRAGDDHLFVAVADGGVAVPLWIPSPVSRDVSDEVSSSTCSVSCQIADGVLDAELNLGLGLIKGDLGLPGASGSSSSISNIRSAVESFGRMLGLNGAFRAALDLLLDFS